MRLPIVLASSCAVFLLLILIDQTTCHSFLVFPPPRVNYQGATFGRKNSDPRLDRDWPRILDQGPSCRIGSNNYPFPGRPSMTFKSGEIIPVTFNIRVPHPSPPGFVIAVWYNDRDDFQNNILMADFNPPEKDAYWGSGEYTFQIRLPDKPCESCVFLWAWGSLKDQGFYLDCSDIRILPQRAPQVPAELLPEKVDGGCFPLSKKTCESTPGCRALWGLAVVTTKQMVYLGCASTQNCNNNNVNGNGNRNNGNSGNNNNNQKRSNVRRKRQRGGPFRFFGPPGRFFDQPADNDFRSLGLAVDPRASGCPDRGCGAAPRFDTRGPGGCIEPINVPNNIHFVVDTCAVLDGYQTVRCPASM